jgi:tyrosine-protein phosphatase YwqE
MIDLHAHILPGVDDGPPTVEDALEMARAAAAAGTRTIAATSHIHIGFGFDIPALAGVRAALAERLAAEEEAMVAELNDVQGQPVDLGGYYHVDRDKATAAMRPSAAFNDAIASLSARV